MSDTVLATDSAVHHAHEAYLTSINSNDVARFLTTVTDDIVFLPPNSEPIAGKEAVGAWVAGYFEAIQTVWTKTTVELVVADGLAYEWYRYHVVDTPRDGGESAKIDGPYYFFTLIKRLREMREKHYSLLRGFFHGATDTGNGVNIYRIDADGTWRVWRDIWATAS